MSKMSELLHEGHTRQARGLALEKLKKKPDDLEALSTLAKAQLVEGELEAAEKTIIKVEKHGITVDTLVLRANVAMQKEYWNTARSLLEHAPCTIVDSRPWTS